MRRLSGVSWAFRCVWELDNQQWKLWMPVRLFQNLRLSLKKIFFPGSYFPGQQNLWGRNLCNEMSQDGIILCHSSPTLYMMSYIMFLQTLHHNFCNCREWKGNRLFTRPILPCSLGKRQANRHLIKNLYWYKEAERYNPYSFFALGDNR